MKIFIISHLSAAIAAMVVDLSTSSSRSNIFDWMIWAFGTIWISVPVTILFYVLLWLQPSLFDNETVFFGMVIFVSASVCGLLFWPEAPFDEKKEEQRQNGRLVTLLQSVQPILPASFILERDKNLIGEHIKEVMIDFDFGNGEHMSSRDFNHFKHIQAFFPIGFGRISNWQIKINSKLYKYLHYLSESTRIRFMTYSPDYKYIIVYIQFKNKAAFRRKTKSCLVVLGEKRANGIQLFDFTRGLEHWLKTNDESYYRFLTGWRDRGAFIDNFTRHSLTRIHDYPLYNIMEKEFWEDPNLFSEIEFNGERMLRYKTVNIDYHNERDREIPYELRKNYLISK